MDTPMFYLCTKHYITCFAGFLQSFPKPNFTQVWQSILEDFSSISHGQSWGDIHGGCPYPKKQVTPA
jgi:hypothetical protein